MKHAKKNYIYFLTKKSTTLDRHGICKLPVVVYVQFYFINIFDVQNKVSDSMLNLYWYLLQLFQVIYLGVQNKKC